MYCLSYSTCVSYTWAMLNAALILSVNKISLKLKFHESFYIFYFYNGTTLSRISRSVSEDFYLVITSFYLVISHSFNGIENISTVTSSSNGNQSFSKLNFQKQNLKVTRYLKLNEVQRSTCQRNIMIIRRQMNKLL